jgi:hypothetical protein
VLSANVHRRHLNSEQKRAALSAYLKADPTVSDRTVAKDLGVDHKTAAKVRDNLEGRGEIPHAEKRTDSKGRQQPAKKPPAKKPTPPAAPDAAERAATTSPTPVAPLERNGAEPEAADTDPTVDDDSGVMEFISDWQPHQKSTPADIQANNLYSAASRLRAVADTVEHELVTGLLLPPEEARKLAERIDPALTQLLVLQKELEAVVLS